MIAVHPSQGPQGGAVPLDSGPKAMRMRTPTAVAHEERCSNAGRQAVNSRRQLVQSLGYRGSRRQMLKRRRGSGSRCWSRRYVVPGP